MAKKKKLNILALITEDSAVGYYRIWQPLKEMERIGLINLKITPTFTWGKEKNEIIKFPGLEWFSSDKGDGFEPDIIVASRHDYPHYIALICAIAKNFNTPLVVDTDDDVQAVRPYNPGYYSYNPSSDLVAFNLKLMSMPDVTAITTSTEHLRERHLRFEKPVYVNPNCIDLKTRGLPKRISEDYDLPADHKKLRIGWLGSACHWENLQIIEQAVKDIIGNFDVEFIYTNVNGDLWSKFPKDAPEELKAKVVPVCNALGICSERHAMCTKAYIDLDEYPKALNKLKLDIGLAPLQDNLFNRSKSNLRILEYWADRIAVIASPVRPYTETIQHGKNGLLAKEPEDWYDAIKTLILDTQLREKLQQNGFKTLETRYNAEDNAKKLYLKYKKIINDFRHPPQTRS